MGGRQKGTPNKASQDLKNWLSRVLNDNRAMFERDLTELLPEERVRVIAGLLNYIIPKQQALSVEEQISNETEALSRWFAEAPQEAIDGIAERVIELQKANQEGAENE